MVREDRWTVTGRAGVFYLQCRPFLTFPRLVHGFSLRRDEAGADFDLGRRAVAETDEVAARRRRFLAGLGLSGVRIVVLEQVHGPEVAVVRSPVGEGGELFVPGADGAVTAEEGTALTIRTADCAALLFFDPVAGVIGAAHAGWRPAAAGIAARTVEKMASLGAAPERIAVAVGPAVGPCCYTVGEEVIGRIPAEARPEAVRKGAGGDYRLDLVALNRWWLIKAGVPAANIFSPGECTACRPEIYFSYRREGGRAGRMMALIARYG